MNHTLIIIINQRVEPIKKAIGVTIFKKNSAADTKANTLTRIIINRNSGRVIK